MQQLLSLPTLMVVLTLAIFIPCGWTLSKPTVTPDPSYTTGTTQLVNANWGSTSPTNFLVNYQTTMSTTSLNASLGIMGINYYIKAGQWGWRLSIVSVAQSSLNLFLNVKSNNNPIYYLRICYFVTSNTLLDVNWATLSFSRNLNLIQLQSIQLPTTR
jgi:hypothetical protein